MRTHAQLSFRTSALFALFAHQSPSALAKLRQLSTSAATPLTDTEARLAETRALEQRVAHIAHFIVLSFPAQLPVALFVGTVAALALDFRGDADR